jgi:glyoxylase-like metal-dependent hydrolase (beta-lactamase superfamily II)
MAYRIENYVVGPVGTNCYFMINEETKEVLVIDPGASAKALYEKIKEGGYIPRAILLTHGHFDHAGAARGLLEHMGLDGYDAEIYALDKEQETLENPMYNLSGMMGGASECYKATVYVQDNDVLHLAGFEIKVLFTPGHTPGGCCFYFKNEGVLFPGDTLFCGSVGRTDFPGGSMSDLVHAVRDRLLVLPDNTLVYPGHEAPTTIADEKRYNPYL